MLNRILHLQTDPGGQGDGGTGGNGDEGTDPTPPASQEDTAGQQTGADDQVPASEVRKANREAAKYRKELREAQARVEELEGASKTETEKLRETATKASAERETLKTANRTLRARVLAPSVGIADKNAAADAAQLLDWSQIQDPENDAEIEEALRELVKDRPYLVGNVAGGSDGGAGGGTVQGEGMNELIRARAGR